ncbi:MAG: YHS domain-containing (seleno)protein [Pseudomonadota bacterium]
MSMNRRHVIAAALGVACAAVAGGPQVARAETPTWADLWGYALRGYDPVAYFTRGEAVEGDPEHRLEWRGVMWSFASAEHKAMFEADPERFAPQFGGYCAWSMMQGRRSSVDPHAWDVIDGKLYMNFSPGMQAAWREEMARNIAEAEKQWAQIVGGEVGGN